MRGDRNVDVLLQIGEFEAMMQKCVSEDEEQNSLGMRLQ